MTFEEKQRILIDYMKLKIEEFDWHGVCDCANDLRVLEADHYAESQPSPKNPTSPYQIFRDISGDAHFQYTGPNGTGGVTKL